jgi:23S rRNA pseudouridine1911/1915/1917 synthase
LVGDATYAARTRLKKGVSPELRDMLATFPRQALHAKALTLIHPRTEEVMEWEIELPDDFIELLNTLADDEDQQEDYT